jgi:hypothetical protein
MRAGARLEAAILAGAQGLTQAQANEARGQKHLLAMRAREPLDRRPFGQRD